MKGWVYVITNQSMPNLVKVGYSMKDPEIRARELYSTGVPLHYTVEYDALVNEPYEVEQKVHKLLKGCIENKEWFRCDVVKAVAAIRQVAGSTIMHESNKSPFNAVDQFNLGWNCAHGNGEEKNLEQAFFWYTKAAEQGNGDAQCNLGVAYENGSGVEKDLNQALYWYEKAAEQGNANAQCNLGIAYESGKGVYKNLNQAVYWYKKAAEQGNVIAQCNLGYSYANSCGVNKNLEQAFFWYKKAAEQGNAIAQCYLGDAYLNSEGVIKNFDNFKQSVFWYTKAAEQGYSKALFNLGLAYSKGYGVTIDKNKAKEWFIKYVEQGFGSDFEKYIGKFIVQDGIATDTETGLMWLRFPYGQQWEKNDVVGKAIKMEWQDAMVLPTIFNQNGFAGYNDWRVPNIDELKTLVDKKKGRIINYIDADVFPKNKISFWSSSPYANPSEYAWYVNFWFGFSNSHHKRNGSHFIRLVR
jgi:TPR repeat protein